MNRSGKIKIIRENIKVKPDIHKALELIGCKTGAEIGVRQGGNLTSLNANSLFRSGFLIGVDCWKEFPENPEFNDENYSQEILDHMYFTCLNKFRNDHHIKIIRSLSKEASIMLSDDILDFIYIDAAHDYESMCDDLNYWWPKLKSGGILSGHDYFPDKRIWRGKECGVFKAVNHFLSAKDLPVIHTTDTDSEGGPNVACNSFFVIK
jgi:hypothetical protein